MNEFLVPEFEAGNEKEYEIKAIRDSAVYAKKADKYLLNHYYLVIWKDYPEEKNTWKPSLTVIYLQKIGSTFYKNHPKKLIMISTLLDSILFIVKPIVKLFVK